MFTNKQIVAEIKKHNGSIDDKFSNNITHIVSSDYNSLSIFEKEAIKAGTTYLVHVCYIEKEFAHRIYLFPQ